MLHKVPEHLHCVLPLFLQPGQHPLSSIGVDEIDVDWSRLAEPPQSPAGLIVLLIAPGWKVGHMRAVLKVQAEPKDGRFADQDTPLIVCLDEPASGFFSSESRPAT